MYTYSIAGTEGTVDSLSHIIRLPFPQLSVHELIQPHGFGTRVPASDKQDADQVGIEYWHEQLEASVKL
jgi:hypothetical protein